MKLTKKQQELRFKILDKIYSKGPISRIEISNETGITPATVSEITYNMINEKLIHEVGEDLSPQNKSGRKKILLNITPNHSFYIGSELSTKYISFCLANNTGEIFKKDVIESNQITESFYISKLNEFIESCKEYKPNAIGIAIPGHFDEKNKRIITNNAFWKNFNLKEILKTITLPIYFKNNVKCMTLAERLFGSNNNNDNFIFFHISRGMFCSYMYNGKLYAENNLLVGEIGHIVVHPNGELCECGKRGCLQTYGSESCIIKKSQILFDNSNNTYLKQLVSSRDEITIESILKAYKLGDEGVITILNSAVRYISITINNLSMMIDSDKVIIHSELFNEPLLVDLLKESLNQNINLLSDNEKQNFIIKEYHNFNGCLAATALCISKYILMN
ncbi:MAG: ROK family protein [Clostridium perfringens]|uniref:ROK family transcriptional regulator n=1 Tax=Clostridium perfringens TaxID=1502 RepID=UPI000D7145F7|nr:ROK family protein [Clostridium perfringens]EHK2336193.1 ROK family protein [Clostridium perfringens]EIL8448210.1 ROK family protein [Clostridium perfringens]ELC8387730.1 ROK family protein [Clostridium perfringens]ELC8408608.1 ROK family protein [Clostridium perfringens]MCX0401871.1 ROK family protein [Clostridium perfringens]